jgi:hypothetical protein
MVLIHADGASLEFERQRVIVGMEWLLLLIKSLQLEDTE